MIEPEFIDDENIPLLERDENNDSVYEDTQTETSFPSELANCLTLIAEDRPEGPPPIIRTSYSMTSLSTCSFIIHLFRANY